MTQFDFDSELFAEFVLETGEALDSLDPLFIKLEEYPDREILDQIFRVMHTAKGNVSVFGFDHIKEFAHILENLLDRIRQDKVHITVDIVDLLLNGKDLLAELIRRQQADTSLNELNDDEKSLLAAIGQIKDEGCEERHIQGAALESIVHKWEEYLSEADMPEVEELLGELKLLLNEETPNDVQEDSTDLAEEFDFIFDTPPGSEVEMPTTPPNPPEESVNEELVVEAEAKPSEKVEKSEKTASGEKATIRVEQEAIDSFLKEVGELITLSEGFKYLGTRMSDANVQHDLRKDFQDISLAFHQLSVNLQQAVLQVRKVSIKALTQKIPRMVRSLSKSLEKDVELIMEGEDTTLDKALVDVLEDPLIHFIRNSLDHGIEAPVDREGKGKDRKGTLRVSATADDEHFYMTIADDGKGIDPQVMKKVVVSKGLMTEDEVTSLSDEEAQQLIFLPGFSTAEKITDVSGRGVGMDVAISNIRKANGHIHLKSTLGIGSEFVIQLPLIGTTVVIQCMQFRVGSSIFVLPLDFIQEVITPDDKNISTVQGTYQILQFRNKTVPISELSHLFGIQGAKQSHEDVVYIVVEFNHQQVAMMVDELMGMQQVVIKDIDKNFETHPAVGGAALMGDGSIAMVLDTKALVQCEIPEHETVS